MLAARLVIALAAPPADAPPVAADPPVDAPAEPSSDPSAPIDDPAAPPIEASDPQPTPSEPAPTEPAPDVQPPPAPTVVAPPRKPAPATVEPAPPQRVKRWPDPLRKGGTLLASAGVAGCSGATACEDIKAAAWFSISGGYRFGRFAPIAMVAGGGAPAKLPATIFVDEQTPLEVERGRASLGFLYVGAGTLLHLLQSTNFDPWFGMTIGYFQNRERLALTASSGAITGRIDHLQVTHRGAIGLQLGLGFRILKRFTLGPRFDFFLPFAGKTCGRDGDMKSGCTKLSDDEELGFDPAEYFPRPWSVGLQAGVVL